MEHDSSIADKQNNERLLDLIGRDLGTLLKEAWKNFVTVAKWVLSGLIEALFIICLVLTQWLVNNYIIIPYSPTGGADKTTLIFAQWLFAIATLSPITFRLIRLIFTMAIRTYKHIQREMNRGPIDEYD